MKNNDKKNNDKNIDKKNDDFLLRIEHQGQSLIQNINPSSASYTLNLTKKLNVQNIKSINFSHK